MQRKTRLTVAIGFLAALAWACGGSDSITNPAASGFAPRAANADRNGTPHNTDDAVLILKRTASIPADISVSANIGPAGGTISIAGTGGQLIVPPGALSSTVTITMTAKAGPDVAYEFEPHGLVFATPAVIQQELGPTWVSRVPGLIGHLTGAYFEGKLKDAFVDPLHLFLHVKEIRNGSSSGGGKRFSFPINHFSGYILACGRNNDYDFDDRW